VGPRSSLDPVTKFRTEREDETGRQRKLRKEELHDLYFSPNMIRIIKEDEMGGACNIHEREKRNVYKIVVGIPEGKRPLGRP